MPSLKLSRFYSISFRKDTDFYMSCFVKIMLSVLLEISFSQLKDNLTFRRQKMLHTSPWRTLPYYLRAVGSHSIVIFQLTTNNPSSLAKTVVQVTVYLFSLDSKLSMTIFSFFNSLLKKFDSQGIFSLREAV